MDSSERIPEEYARFRSLLARAVKPDVTPPSTPEKESTSDPAPCDTD